MRHTRQTESLLFASRTESELRAVYSGARCAGRGADRARGGGSDDEVRPCQR